MKHAGQAQDVTAAAPTRISSGGAVSINATKRISRRERRGPGLLGLGRRLDGNGATGANGRFAHGQAGRHVPKRGQSAVMRVEVADGTEARALRVGRKRQARRVVDARAGRMARMIAGEIAGALVAALGRMIAGRGMARRPGRGRATGTVTATQAVVVELVAEAHHRHIGNREKQGRQIAPDSCHEAKPDEVSRENDRPL